MELSKIGNLVGTVFQDPRSQFFMMDPFNEVAFGLCNRCLNKDEIKQRVKNSLQILSENSHNFQVQDLAYFQNNE